MYEYDLRIGVTNDGLTNWLTAVLLGRL